MWMPTGLDNEMLWEVCKQRSLLGAKSRPQDIINVSGKVHEAT